MKNEIYVLVHGAWHGPQCWYGVVERLQRAGQTALTPGLSREEILVLLRVQPRPVILVGHSRGGLAISEAAERLPEKVKRLVYVSGLLLRDGESGLRVLREEGNSPLLREIVLSKDKSEWLLDEERARELFYARSPPGDIELARIHRTREPAAPLMTPLKISAERFGRVPRAYVHCLDDRAIPIGLQRRMVAALPCSPVYTLDADHSPFFSAPAELAARLLDLRGEP